MTVLIEAVGLHKRFADIKAVDGISLKVPKGEVLGFLGPNGAGKSTTMKMITGFLEPDAGKAAICGIDVFEEPKKAKMLFGYVPEGAPSYGEMTPRTFLSFIAEIRGFRGAEITSRVARSVDRAGLEPVLDQVIDTLSKGYKRRVGLAQAILHDPPVLIMDEPTDGLDPNQKHHVRQLISEMAADKAIIISTHILEEVEAVCSRAVVINKGIIVADGTADDLLQRMHYHGAVSLKVVADRADAAIRALSGAPVVERVETIGKPNGHLLLRAIPRQKTMTAAEIAAVLRAQNIPVDELYVERGRLDDVFRQITMPEEGDRDA
ncbi:ABC transporter ATP-binding protein [Hyphomicrobium denitrificans 1NES1]|uniref:ABC transporter ATP-binding protein n=1 Tax=Hyphomicrobium denitrificans 1NES1 TaxID=670307 RepID=N0B7W8_9HYPH|nr:ABC transporter ATP-binding protein [Hyphomicrobium denitrificans]AGK59108.1 ABC transporter ATP-binding protein [Hyphomicrobium denitrificans 1NES1]